MLLAYHPPCCATSFLTELAEVILHVMLENPFIAVLRNLNIHAEDASKRPVSDSMDSMTTTELSQYTVTHMWAGISSTWSLPQSRLAILC